MFQPWAIRSQWPACVWPRILKENSFVRFIFPKWVHIRSLLLSSIIIAECIRKFNNIKSVFS